MWKFQNRKRYDLLRNNSRIPRFNSLGVLDSVSKPQAVWLIAQHVPNKEERTRTQQNQKFQNRKRYDLLRNTISYIGWPRQADCAEFQNRKRYDLLRNSATKFLTNMRQWIIKFQNRKRYDLLRNLKQTFPRSKEASISSFKTASGMTYCATPSDNVTAPRELRWLPVSKPQAVWLIAQQDNPKVHI